MEPIGFTIGVVGLASVFGATVDAFGQIKAARSFGRDYEILSTRYDIRRARLLQWGDGVGLLSQRPRTRDIRLDQEHLQPLLESALNCIWSMLGDADSLRSRYGLQELHFENGELLPMSQSNISEQRLQNFKSSYSRFMSKIKNRQKHTTLIKKAQWAIGGGDGFRTLLQDLDGMIEDLYRLVPINSAFQRLMIEKDISGLPDNLMALRLTEEACCADESVNLTETATDSWLEEASLRVEATEMATQDRRIIDEWLEDVGVKDGQQVEIGGSVSFPHPSSHPPPQIRTPPQLPSENPLVMSVLFVCGDNLCRSPMAEAIFRSLTQADPRIGRIDSAGHSVMQESEPTDWLTLETLGRHGITGYSHCSRSVVADDFVIFDFIVPVDRESLQRLTIMPNIALFPNKAELTGDPLWQSGIIGKETFYLDIGDLLEDDTGKSYEAFEELYHRMLPPLKLLHFELQNQFSSLSHSWIREATF